jgi:hypothetical protein
MFSIHNLASNFLELEIYYVNKNPGEHKIISSTGLYIYQVNCSMTSGKNTLFLGVKVEGILRQSADVEEVKRRIRDYEKGDFL